MGDEYDRRARVYPALLTVAPLSLTAVVFGITSANWWETAASLVVASGFWFLAAQVGRTPGKSLEPDLWKSWGGAPTTILLRHRDAPNPVRLAQLHRHVFAVAHLRAPSAAEEEADPAGADHTYEAVTKSLIGKTRDATRFSLLFKENMNYGFRRNMLGLRRWGIAACIAAVLLTLFVLITDQPSFLNVQESVAVTLIFFDVLAATAWWRLVTSEWVKQPAFAYAERLLEAASTLAEVEES